MNTNKRWTKQQFQAILDATPDDSLLSFKLGNEDLDLSQLVRESRMIYPNNSQTQPTPLNHLVFYLHRPSTAGYKD